MTSAAAYMLYLVFALGGVGLYLLLPKAGVRQTFAGAIIGLLAVVGLILVLATQIIGPGSSAGFFYLFAVVAVLAAARVITHPKPVYSAVYFVLVVVAVTALLVLMNAEFLAVALLIIYAGAILVTYLFVIMLAQQSGSPVYDRRSREPFWAVLAGFVLMAAVAGRAGDLPPSVADASESATATAQSDQPGNTSAIGAIIMTKHIVALEVAGVLLLISMIGALAMVRKELPVETLEPPPKPLGQIGREVQPF